MSTAAPPPINLAVLRQNDEVTVALTDSRSIAKLARCNVSEEQWRDLHDTAEDLQADSRPGPAFRAYGERLFSSLLPPSIRSFLRAHPGCLVSLQLEPALTSIPWELAFDGERFLGEKFGLARRIVDEERIVSAPGQTLRRGLLKVLVVDGFAPEISAASPAIRLVAQLRMIDGVAVRIAHTADSRHNEPLDFARDDDIVHFVGPVAPAVAANHRSTWWLAGAPQLLIVHELAASERKTETSSGRALAVSVCRHGFNVALCTETRSDGPDLDFLHAVYRHLAQGTTLGETFRAARAERGARPMFRQQAELYGDGALVVFAKSRQTRSENNLRQVTIMSFDLVDSTRLIAQLGDERYSEILAEYHQRCAQILTSRGGAPDDPQANDGIMCYFGFPVAHEGAANQALHAGFALIDAVRALGLAVRIGVCTGQVVVRDGQPVGAPIHFAARLQSIAAPGTMVVGESTYRIVGDRFRFAPLDQVPTLKGFEQPEPLYRALGSASTVIEHAGAIASPPITPFVGRRRELQALDAHWSTVQAGALQIVQIVGEAGIGKSRLVREFKRALIVTGHELLECRCAPDHVASAFLPLIDGLRNQLRIASGDSGPTVLRRLKRLAGPLPAPDEAVALLAELLSLSLPSSHPVLTQSAERRRQLTLNVLVTLARQRLQRSPACLIVEDIHWIDPSTAEFLNRLAEDAKALPLLILVTARPDNEVRWSPRVAVHEIQLRGLAPESARVLVLGHCGETRLPSAIVHLLAARGDGVPLFIEESTKMAIELGAGRPDAQSSTIGAVPTTIADLLAARLDRLGRAKQIAQIGGIIGREFPLGLLQAVLAHPDSSLSGLDAPTQLAALIRSGLVVARGDGGSYRFTHALMRDAAYRSLLERDRVRLHRLIATVIAEQFHELATSQPELLAFHLTEAGATAEALTYWESAARRAASRSAQVEAISHVSNALAALARLPRDGGRDRIELRLQLLLATRLIATEGYGAERVERVYARAMELAQSLGDDSGLMKVMLGLEGYHFMRADFPKAHAIAHEAARRAQTSAEPIHRVQAQWALANLMTHQGEMDVGVQQMDECRAAYDRLEHRPAAVQDPGVMCLCYSAWNLWQLGYPDQALARTQEVVSRAKQLQHTFSIGQAYGFRASIHHFRGENVAALASAERAIEICEENGFVVWLAHAQLIHGRILAETGDNAAGVNEMLQAYELWTTTGAVVSTPLYLAMRAEGLALGGRLDEGLALLEQAIATIERTGERYYEAEVRRLIGEMHLKIAARNNRDASVEAERWLRDALDCAQTLRLYSLSLRSATSLAALWNAQGRVYEATSVLESAISRIDEGAGTRDLIQARRLLDLLRQERRIHR